MLEGDHSGDAAKRSGRHAEGVKKALEHEKTPELAAKLAAEPLSATRGRHRLANFRYQNWSTGGLKCLERGERQRSMSAFGTSQRHLNNRGAQQKLAEALAR